MLEKIIRNDDKEHIDYKDMTKQLQQNLSELQLMIRDRKIPVIIIFEGWGASGKGSLIADTIKMLDPRFFKVYSTLPLIGVEHHRGHTDVAEGPVEPVVLGRV